MKKRIVAMMIILLIFLPTSKVRADVVFGNDFYFRNRDDIEPLNRLFVVNGTNGFVSAKEAPGSSDEVSQFRNGSMIMIGSVHLYSGSYWGMTPMGHAYGMPGWVSMDELLMLYDHVDFVEEYQENLYVYSGSFEGAIEDEGYYVWRWPGSDMEKRWFVSDYMDAGDFDAIYAYMDDEGREWVYCRIMGGEAYGGLSLRNAATGWICLSDAANESIPMFKPAPEPIAWQKDGNHNWYETTQQAPAEQNGNSGNIEAEEESPNTSSLKIIAILVASLVVCTVILIKFIWKPEKKR